MTSKNKENIIKLFGVANQFTELELDKIESDHKIDLGRKKIKSEKDTIYYPQFPLEVRQEANAMAKHYEIFYCLEKSIRDLITTTLNTSGESWWTQKFHQM